MAIRWFLGNAAFGLAPLLFLFLINPVLNEHEQASEEIHNLLKGGAVLFVCCALMGAVVIDILTEKLSFKKWSFFAVNIAPFFLLAVILILYLLIILGHVNQALFSTFSKFYVFVIVFTVIYCILGKYLLYNNQS